MLVNRHPDKSSIRTFPFPCLARRRCDRRTGYLYASPIWPLRNYATLLFVAPRASTQVGERGGLSWGAPDPGSVVGHTRYMYMNSDYLHRTFTTLLA